MTKYIFITGGVVSSIGKGIVAASLGNLLKARGLSIAIQKFDPYLNIDPGTMSPYQHGEVFVTDDGAETDLDLGHYERFIDTNANRYSSITSGKIYSEILANERQGTYLGKTVQVIPHVTDAIKDKIFRVGQEKATDIVITEVGGTIGDIESLPFLEAIRQMKRQVGEKNVILIHTTLVPYIAAAQEFKTKPTQHSVKEMRSLGLQPNFLVLRSEKPLSENIKEKVASFCDVDVEKVIESPDVATIYEIPLILKKQAMDEAVLKHFDIQAPDVDHSEWQMWVEKLKTLNQETTIAIVGKYIELPDAYLSVIEALRHAGVAHDTKVNIKWIQAEDVTSETVASLFEEVDGLIVPGGFGVRGTEGKMVAIQYARENNLPFLGICLGMQLASIEFARNVAGIDDAGTAEENESIANKVIDLMPDQNAIDQKGGTLRLGQYACHIKEGSLAQRLYKTDVISERHRHRYEFNNDYRQKLEDAGLVFSGLSPDSRLVEIIELPTHPYFIAAQFHPEFLSRPMKPHPLFLGLIKASTSKY